MKHEHTSMRGIIYDLDGTLLDSLQDLGETANELLADLGYQTLPLFVYRDLVGNGIAELCRRSLALSLTLHQMVCFDDSGEAFLPGILEKVRDKTNRPQPDPSVVAAFIEDFYSRYETNWRRNTRPFPDVIELLEIVGNKGYRQGLLSNKADPFVKAIADRYFSPSLFDVILGQLAHIPSKPSPQAPLMIAQEWQLPPESILFIGDSDVDMQTALAANMVPVAVTWGFRDRQELARAGAAYILETPFDLLDLL
ncbi:MAG TPA: HAD family hydrolase [Clostridiaceae bacterium]|nr:HAD family hydrolase [Clostridiaceae bacterium]